MSNTFRMAMPIAHESGASLDYARYYREGTCIFQIQRFFNERWTETENERICEGLNISISDANIDSDCANIYALTDGYLSYKSHSLVLRLPRELRTSWEYNSGGHFLGLWPRGPQLRYVIYEFATEDNENNIKSKIGELLDINDHPMGNIQGVMLFLGESVIFRSLRSFLSMHSSRKDEVLNKFMNGYMELFVRAGDPIGNFFEGEQVTIKFLDSCGSPNKELVSEVLDPIGRPLNPSYFLFILLSSLNRTHIDLLTELQETSDYPHPLLHLLSSENITETQYEYMILDLTQDHPPNPLHVTVPINENKGIRIGALSEWHESRNATNPYNTCAPIKWRIYGDLEDDTNNSNIGKLIAQIKDNNRIPSNLAEYFDSNTDSYLNHIRNYWSRYGALINAVADAMKVPCELILTIACKESALWWNTSLNASNEMSVVRFETLDLTDEEWESMSEQNRTYMTNYRTMREGRQNAVIPIPWDGDAEIVQGLSLTWDQLARIVNEYCRGVRISPGVMQTLVSTAREDLDFIKRVYGNNFLPSITADVSVNGNEFTLAVENPLDNDEQLLTCGQLLTNWFAVSTSNNAETKMKRAFHGFTVGAAHIKRHYNCVKGLDNWITDFDPPTVASGYNDGAEILKGDECASQSDDDNVKWNKLFAMRFYGNYPQEFSRYYNAAIEYFNEENPNPPPSVRLWRSNNA